MGVVLALVAFTVIMVTGHTELIARSRYQKVLVNSLQSVFTDPLEPIKVLDFGSGNGRMTEKFPANCTITHLDIIDADKIKCDNYVQYDGHHIPFPDQAFDVGIVAFCLHHVEHQTAILLELKRVCKRVIVFEDNIQTETAYKVSKWHYKMFHQDPSLVKLMKTPNQWIKVFKKLGFTVNKWQGVPGHFLYPVDHILFELQS